ncbi:MAG: hypothetical protein ACOC2L_04180 [Candidatus Sumerlaeota bacterium]
MQKMRLSFLVILLSLLMLGLSACSGIQGPGEADSPVLSLMLTLDKDSYKPGEMVVAEIELVNMLDETIAVEQPHCAELPKDSNLHIRVTPADKLDPLRHGPVEIRADIEPTYVLVPPYQSRRVKYAFTTLTRKRGDFLVWAEYDRKPYRLINPTGSLTKENLEIIDISPVFSTSMPYSVEGERLFERNIAGILTKEAAVKVAREAYGKPVKQARAALVETQSDLYDYWVTLQKQPDDVGEEETSYVSYFISPYGGFIRGEAPHMVKDASQFRLDEMQKEMKQPNRRTLLKPMKPIREQNLKPPPKVEDGR